jgi:hypothetical protein
LILGAYHFGNLTSDGIIGYFAQGTWQKPIDTIRDFRPADEFNLAIGSYYNFGEVGIFDKVSPLLQLVGSERLKDRGLNANLSDSGYSRMMFSPGIELETEKLKFYADFSVPIYNDVKGNQLAVSQIFKFIVGYKF